MKTGSPVSTDGRLLITPVSPVLFLPRAMGHGGQSVHGSRSLRVPYCRAMVPPSPAGTGALTCNRCGTSASRPYSCFADALVILTTRSSRPFHVFIKCLSGRATVPGVMALSTLSSELQVHRRGRPPIAGEMGGRSSAIADGRHRTALSLSFSFSLSLSKPTTPSVWIVAKLVLAPRQRCHATR